MNTIHLSHTQRANMSKSSSQSALRFLRKALLLVPVFFVGETCTKLTEVPHDALTPTTAFHTDQEILAGLAVSTRSPAAPRPTTTSRPLRSWRPACSSWPRVAATGTATARGWHSPN